MAIKIDTGIEMQSVIYQRTNYEPRDVLSSNFLVRPRFNIEHSYISYGKSTVTWGPSFARWAVCNYYCGRQ